MSRRKATARPPPQRRAARRALWANPAYVRLWSAVAISETGDWLLFIALPLYTLGVSGSALNMSLVWVMLMPLLALGAGRLWIVFIVAAAQARLTSITGPTLVAT